MTSTVFSLCFPCINLFYFMKALAAATIIYHNSVEEETEVPGS